MTDYFIRTTSIFFAIALAYIGLSFSTGVGENINIVFFMFYLLLWISSQLGLFLSTYSIKNRKWNLLITVIMLPFFMLLLKFTFFDSGFLNRLTGSPVQIRSSIAYIAGFSVYTYSFYIMVKSQYNKKINQG